MKIYKILILRVILIVALFGAWVGTCFVKKIYHYPVEWLLHYLVGTGRDKKVPARLVKEAEMAFLAGIEKNDLGNIELGGEYAISHSTLYAGAGFHERPALFYVIGCSMFNYDPRTGKVWGSDHYDWHSDPDAQSYFTSPLGYNKWIVLACDVMGRIFGNDLFINKHSDKSKLIISQDSVGQAAISNKLWEVLGEAGAKDFNSFFEGYIHIPKTEAIELIKDHRRNGYDHAARRFERIVARSYDVPQWRVHMKHWAGSFCSMKVDGVIRYFKIDGSVIYRTNGYELAMAKAYIHAASFNQRAFKYSLMEKRGIRVRRNNRPRRPQRS